MFRDQDLTRVYFSVHKDGKGASVQRKIFSECFFTMGFLGYYAVTNDIEYLHLAKILFQSIQKMINDGSILRPSDKRFQIESKLTPLNIPMITLNIITEFWELVPHTQSQYHELARWCLTQIRAHVDDENCCVREMCIGDNKFDDTTADGRLLCPGHVIECGWFILSLERFKFFDTGFDVVQFSEKIIEDAFQKGWDPKFGGFWYFCNALDLPRTELEHNLKLWWPMTEAMIAFAYLFKHTRNPKYLERLHQIWDICKHKFVHKSGEWYGYLSPTLEVNQRILGGPYKGCFHVPRGLWMTSKILKDCNQSAKL